VSFFAPAAAGTQKQVLQLLQMTTCPVRRSAPSNSGQFIHNVRNSLPHSCHIVALVTYFNDFEHFFVRQS